MGELSLNAVTSIQTLGMDAPLMAAVYGKDLPNRSAKFDLAGNHARAGR